VVQPSDAELNQARADSSSNSGSLAGCVPMAACRALHYGVIMDSLAPIESPAVTYSVPGSRENGLHYLQTVCRNDGTRTKNWESMKTISVEQLRIMRDRQDDIELISVLSADQFRAGHIPDSDNIPVDDQHFIERVDRVAHSRNQKIVLYCASPSCNASEKAARILDEAGFTNVYAFAGGLKAWQEAKLPVEGNPALQ
jgi:rhodanese-related sulfurtransferase